MIIVSWILAFYPRSWRGRYQEEMMALLEQHTITLKTIFDLLLGALDAQLDPNYRAKEGFMFHKFHDIHFLSYIYIGALALFLVAINCWALTIDGLTYMLNSLGAPLTFTHIAPIGVTIIGPVLVMIISFLALIGSTFSTLRDAFKNRSFGIVFFALLCLGASIIIFFPSLNEGAAVEGWTTPGVTALIAAVSFFITGIKGLKMLRSHQISPILFAILIDFIVPSLLLVYGSVGLSFGVPTWTMLHTFSQFIPYISIGALLLILADTSLNKQSWRLMRGIGILFALLLTIEVAIVVIWDVNCWIAGSGGIEIYGVPHGIWALVGGQGSIVLIANALILISMLALVVIALLRAFIIHPERRLPASTVTMAYK
jgi:hypothetical protein